MKRAAVLIGIEKTGGLPKLRAAREGAERLHAWAQAKGIDAHLITDANGPVKRQAIFDKVNELVDSSRVDQLLIYFGGHGVNLRFSEYWLLSDAPVDSTAAVNVDTSAALARRCGIPHVVLISDACRTAAEGIRAQSVDGGAIFPNLDPSGTEKAVDLFFATVLGSPALEIREMGEAARRYTAIYTSEFRAALEGKYPEYLTADPENGEMVLRPRPLKKLLAAKVPALVARMVGNAAAQTPDARITSEDEAWMARFETPPLAPSDALRSFGIRLPDLSEARQEPASATSGQALRSALASGATVAVANLLKSDVAGAKEIASAVQRETLEFGPTHFKTSCGFKIRGAKVVSALAASVGVELLDPTLVGINTASGADNVLLEFEDGRGVLLPAIPDFLATLSFEDGELRNVAYEPSEHTRRWADYIGLRDELTTLRTLIAASAREGGFRLDRDDAPQLTDRIRSLKIVDPTMALYAAYSYHNLGRRDLIRDMQGFMKSELGITFFDVAMLAGEKIPPHPRLERIFPFAPLLAQGWSLLDAFGGPLPGRLPEMKRCVGTSLWTVYHPPGIPIIRDALRG